MRFWNLLLTTIFCSFLNADPFVYVSNRFTDNVSVVDIETNTVVATITVGDDPDFMFIPPDGSNLLYVPNDESTISVIDILTNTVVNTLTGFTNPRFMVTTFNGFTAYIGDNTANNVTVMDLTTEIIIATIPIGSPSPFFLAITPDEKKVYCTSSSGTFVSIIDTSTNTVTNSIDLGTTSSGIGITPDGQKAYIVGLNSTNVWAVDVNTDTILATIVTPGAIGFPRGMDISPDGSTVYVPEFNQPEVYIIDTASNTVTGSIIVAGLKDDVAFSLDGTRAYVSARGNDDLVVIDISTSSILTRIPVGTSPQGVSISPLFVSTSGKCKKNRFLTQTDLIASVSWITSPTAVISEFRIYRDRELTDFIGTVDANSPLEFDEHSSLNGKNTLFVQAVNDVTPIGLGSILIDCN